MAQLEHPDNLDRFDNPAHRLITLILMRCGLRVTDALRLRSDCVVTDAEGAPYLRYFNHKMKRDALVPIDDHLADAIVDQQTTVISRWPARHRELFPRPTKNIDGTTRSAAAPTAVALLALARRLRRPRRTRPAGASHAASMAAHPRAHG